MLFLSFVRRRGTGFPLSATGNRTWTIPAVRTGAREVAGVGWKFLFAATMIVHG
jgi:hypothetical protein